MEKMFRINDIPSDTITYFHLAAFLVAIPFDPFYSECILVSLLVHTSIHLTKQRIAAVRFTQLLPIILYALTIAYTWFPPGREQAFLDWQKQLALFLFPLLFALTSLDLRRVVPALMLIFAYTCTIATAYLFFDAWRVIRFLKIPLMSIFSNGFTHHNFSAPFDIHSTYFSMFVALSFSVFLFRLGQTRSVALRALYILCCGILFAGLLQLASRAVIVTLLLVVNIVFPFCCLQGRKRRRFIIISVLASAICISVLAAFPPARERLYRGFEEDLGITSTTGPKATEPRVARWRAAIELVNTAPITGHGSGSERILLRAEYFREHLYSSFLHGLNAHNQYLSFLIKNGIPGLLLYLYVLFAGFSNAIRKKDFIFCSFLLLVMLVSFTENILDVNKGIFFFSFFYALFSNAIPAFDAGVSFSGFKKWVGQSRLIRPSSRKADFRS